MTRAVNSKNLYILSFLLILAAIGLSLQFSHASTDEEEESDREDEQDSEGEEESSEDAEDTTVANQTTPKPKINTSGVFPTNQTLNQTGVTEGISPADIGPPAYRVKTTIYNIQVHNDHDGLTRGNGEWDLAAFVQGRMVHLTEKSCINDVITTVGRVPPCGLGSIEEGNSAIFFDEGKPLDSGVSVTVDLPRTVPLSIFTAGIEEDDCGRAKFPEAPQPVDDKYLMVLMRDERLNWIEPIRQYIGTVRPIDNSFTTPDPICYWDEMRGSDKLGNIIRFYEPPDYGKSESDACIRDKSDSGDYTLCYRITVTPLDACPSSHIPEHHTYCKK